jgi:CRP-like cAMP-binding protein
MSQTQEAGTFISGGMGVSSMTTIANELYANLTPHVQHELAGQERAATVPEGSKLLTSGDVPEQLIILVSGSAELTIPAAGKPLSLGTAGPGKVFGLRSIICGENQEIDVTCLEECEIVLLPGEAFLQLLRGNPQMYFAVVKVLSADLKKAHGVLRQKTRKSKNHGIRRGA